MEGREAQAELYGAPLGDILRQCGHALGLNQSQLAEVLGISAPMLSQLVNARRVKLGNPVAAQRLQVMHESAALVMQGELEIDEALQRIEAVHGGGELLSTRRNRRDETVVAVQALFRSVASATDHLSAADMIETEHPEIAEMLRSYGASRSDVAAAHLLRHRGRR